jgi:DNA-binding response OmpR family regulator
LEGTVIIGISGYADQQSRARALAAGFDHYLVKPEDPAHLQGLLDRVVAPGMSDRGAGGQRGFDSDYGHVWSAGARPKILASTCN